MKYQYIFIIINSYSPLYFPLCYLLMLCQLTSDGDSMKKRRGEQMGGQ